MKSLTANTPPLSTPITDNLLPYLYQYLHDKQLEITCLKKQIYKESDQYFFEIVQKQKVLYQLLKQEDQKYNTINQQMEEFQEMYTKLKQIQENKVEEIQELEVLKQEMENRVREAKAREIVNEKIMKQRQPQLKTQYEKYQQNKQKYTYLQKKNSQLQKNLLQAHKSQQISTSTRIPNKTAQKLSHNLIHEKEIHKKQYKKRQQSTINIQKQNDGDQRTMSTLINDKNSRNRVQCGSEKFDSCLKLMTLSQFDI